MAGDGPNCSKSYYTCGAAFFTLSLCFILFGTGEWYVSKAIREDEFIETNKQFFIQSELTGEYAHIRYVEYLVIGCTYIVFGALDVVVCILLLVGVKKKCKWFLIPWVIVMLCLIAVATTRIIYGTFFQIPAIHIFESILTAILIFLTVSAVVLVIHYIITLPAYTDYQSEKLMGKDNNDQLQLTSYTPNSPFL